MVFDQLFCFYRKENIFSRKGDLIMVSIEQSIDLAANIMDKKRIDEDDKQDIYLMIITDFQYLKDLEPDAAESLIERLIKAYTARAQSKHINFKDGFGFGLSSDFNPSQLTITEEVKNIIDCHLYPEERDVVIKLFGLNEQKNLSVNEIATNLHKTVEEVEELYKTSMDVIRMLLNIY